EKIKTVHSSSNRIVVDNGVLEKYTDFCYGVTVSWLNHYCPPQGQSEAKLLHTGFGYPSAPKEPKALALTPDTVLLSWTLPDLLSAPITEIRYR
uniref:Fibronectin type-III domain-containing protein n=1 Tax=Globodera pallida TaxID=36090 RepID=A0A183CS73_GLOPA